MTTASRASAIPDSATETELKMNLPDFPRTSTTTESPIRINVTSPYWRDVNEAIDGVLVVAFDVTSVNIAGENSYQLAIVSDTSEAMSSPTVLAACDVRAIGNYKLVVDLKQLPLADVGALWLAARVIISGSSSPSIAYGASIVDGVR